MQAKADLPCAHAGCRQWVVCRCTAACHDGSCTCKRAVQASSHDSAQFQSCLTVLHVFGAADSQLRDTHDTRAAHNSTGWLLRSRLAAWSQTCEQHAGLAFFSATNWGPCQHSASAHSLAMWPTLSVFCSVRQHTTKHGRKCSAQSRVQASPCLHVCSTSKDNPSKAQHVGMEPFVTPGGLREMAQAHCLAKVGHEGCGCMHLTMHIPSQVCRTSKQGCSTCQEPGPGSPNRQAGY